VTDSRKDQFIPTKKFITTITNEPIFLTKIKLKSSSTSDPRYKDILKVNPIWTNAFFNWNDALRNPSSVLPATTFQSNSRPPDFKNRDSQQNQVLINANFVNEMLPKYINQKFSLIGKNSGGYTNQFGFWALLYLEFSLKLLVPSEYYIMMLNLKTQNNVIFFDSYNEIEYALSYLSRFEDIIYTNGSGRKFIKLPSFGKLNFTFEKDVLESEIGNDINYWTLWPLFNNYISSTTGGITYSSLVNGLLTFTNEIVAMHYYPTFSYEHYLYFENVDEYVKHQIYNVMRTYKAQIALQDNLGMNRIERRAYYLTIVCPFIKNYLSEIEHYYGKSFLYLNLFGALPFDSGSSITLPHTYVDFFSYYNSRFGNFCDFGALSFSTVEDEYKNKKLGPYQVFFVYPQMFELLCTVVKESSLVYNFRQINFQNSDISHAYEIDSNNLTACKNIEYPLGNPLPINTIESIPPNLLEVSTNIKMSFNSNFLSPYSMYVLPIIDIPHLGLFQSDEQRLTVYRQSVAQRRVLMQLQQQALDPVSLKNKFITPNLIKCQIPVFEYLFWATYCLNEMPYYTFSGEGDEKYLDVLTIPTSTDDMQLNKVNSSSFVLLSLVFQYLSEYTAMELVKPNSVLFLGAQNEPVADMLIRLTHRLWSVQRSGANGELPAKKANIHCINVKNTYDLVISDMDQSLGVDVAAITGICIAQLKKCLECFSKRLIFRIQYCFFDTVKAIVDLLKVTQAEFAANKIYFKMKFVKSCWSEINSIEIFLILDKVTDQFAFPSDDNLRFLVNTFGYINVSNVFFTYMGTPKKYNLADLSCKIFNVDVTKEDFPTVLSMFMNLSSCVTYGASKNDSSKSYLTIFGTTSIQRIGLFMRNKQLFTSLALDGLPHRPEGIFDSTKDFQIQSAREVLVLSDAQRFKCWQLLRSLYLDEGNLDVKLTVYDIGCRDYECAYLTVMDEDTIMPYVGIDRGTILDVKRGIELRKEEVKREEFTKLAAKGHVFMYNSYLMNFSSREALEQELDFIADTLVIKGVLLLTFYSLHDQLLPILKDHGFIDITSSDVTNNKFTFGRYHGVATVDYTFVLAWLRKMLAKYDINQIYLSSDDVCLSSVMHGYSINLDSLHLVPVFNLVQPCFLIRNKKVQA
jgi:hypothetical protein